MAEASIGARWRGEPFFPVMAVILAALVFAGFGPDYYLRPAAAGPLSALYHAHGALFTAWFLLFAAQATLIGAGRVRLHMGLGASSLLLAAAMAVTGFMVAADAYARDVGFLGSAAVFGMVTLTDLGGFVVLYAAAILNRGRPDFHKRLMLLAGIAMILPATGRLGFYALGDGVYGLLMQFLLAAVVLGYDVLRLKRPHPVTLIVIAWLVLRVIAVFTLARTDGWAQFISFIF
ncbi:MAG: hypothetical protein KIS81_00555 [Maricaulaceae bacterium]|nr:hypothetical protein [Maricaulaceae bacterium]